MEEPQLLERIAKLEADHALLAAANVKLLNRLIEMWHRHAEMSDAQGREYEATQWRRYAADLVALMLDH